MGNGPETPATWWLALGNHLYEVEGMGCRMGLGGETLEVEPGVPEFRGGPLDRDLSARWNALYRLVNGYEDVGAPGVRDPDSECEYFRPRGVPNDVPRLPECGGDSHYLCRECENLTPCPDTGEAAPAPGPPAEADQEGVRSRARRAAQSLIEEVGAAGPENVATVAERAVALGQRLRTELEQARADRDAFRAENARIRAETTESFRGLDASRKRSAEAERAACERACRAVARELEAGLEAFEGEPGTAEWLRGQVSGAQRCAEKILGRAER